MADGGALRLPVLPLDAGKVVLEDVLHGCTWAAFSEVLYDVSKVLLLHIEFLRLLLGSSSLSAGHLEAAFLDVLVVAVLKLGIREASWINFLRELVLGLTRSSYHVVRCFFWFTWKNKPLILVFIHLLLGFRQVFTWGHSHAVLRRRGLHAANSNRVS